MKNDKTLEYSCKTHLNVTFWLPTNLNPIRLADIQHLIKKALWPQYIGYAYGC